MTMTAQRLNGPNLICITRKFQDSLGLFPNPPSLRKWTEFTRPHCPHCRGSGHQRLELSRLRGTTALLSAAVIALLTQGLLLDWDTDY